ncbi:MAG: class I SAM-dependent methyltransferase [Omnitrophica WOR_2 bacterium]
MIRIPADRINPVAETALIALYYRALESRAPDAILKDPCAARLVEEIDFDFSTINPSPMSRLLAIMRTRQFDRMAAAFLAAGHPGPVVIEIGCGLDTRFERLNRPKVPWYALDLPEVIRLRHELLGSYPNYFNLAASAFDLAWLDQLPSSSGASFLFLAEGVFEYFYEADVRRLVLAIMDRCPGAELVFSATPFVEERLSGLHPALRGKQARLHWGMRRDIDPQSWRPGIRLLERWTYFDLPEPRLRPYRWVGWIPWFGKEWRILRYRLGG